MTSLYNATDGIAVITLANPPLNALGYETRRAFATDVHKAASDDQIKAIVVIGGGRGFCAGADIGEFDSPESLREPNLMTLISLLESSSKPVVAAVHGVCLGGGLELALGCHYRVFAPGALVGLPEVKLGLIPGAGGTQRLPRVLDVESALNMIVSGEPIKSEQLAALPGQKLVDKLSVSTESLLNEAVDYARDVASDCPAHLPHVRDLKSKHPEGATFFPFAKNSVGAASKSLPAPLECVGAVEDSTTLSFEDGLAAERRRFTYLQSTPQSQSLRHLFLAERAASKVADMPQGTVPRPIGSAGIVGAGMMGTGIAMAFLNSGIPVTLLETAREALDKGVATIDATYAAQVKKGKLSATKHQERMTILKPTLAYEDFAHCDIVVEAAYEEISVKEKVFRELDRVAKPGAIFATNTSTLDVNQIASFTSRPSDVVGLHFFSPANVMKLLEVVRGAATSHAVLATSLALAKTIRKTAVVSGVCDGFIGNRMIEEYLRQAGYLLDEGASPAQVDKAIEKFGFAMGPFRMSDLAGNDIGWAIRKRRALNPDALPYSRVPDRLCEVARFGQKTGAGWYDYKPGKRDALPSDVVSKVIDDNRRELGVTPRKISDEEIVQRLVYALVNEGAHILDEGIAARASDIDLVYAAGYGFPAWRGGPLHYAQTVGLYNVVEAMRTFESTSYGASKFWKPARLLELLAAEGGKFA